MIRPGAQVALEIEKPAAGGRMLARHAGQVMLVAGAIPGERVVVRVERVGKGVAFADVQEVLTASADRRAGMSDWRCGGNVYAYVAYPRQLALKAQVIQDAFSRIGRLPLAAAPEVLGSPETGYRMRARLHVQGDRIGFYREGTHQLCDAGATGQLLPVTTEAIGRIESVLRDARRADLHGPPALIGIEIAENVPADQRAVHLEFAPGADAARYAALTSGATSVTDTIHVADGTTLTLTRDVRAFFQGNRYLLEPLARRVVGLASGEEVVDLYAGVGLFGLSLAAAGATQVTLVEGDPTSGADLVRNAESFGERVRVVRDSVERFLGRRDPQSRPAETFIVDPPRTGMTREALAGIVNHGPRRIVYVSCDVATLARDARTLVDAGYELTEIMGIDLFPNTAHVESIVVFVR